MALDARTEGGKHFEYNVNKLQQDVLKMCAIFTWQYSMVAYCDLLWEFEWSNANDEQQHEKETV